MDLIVTRAKNYLIMVKGAPGAFVSNRDGMIAMVSSILYLLIQGFNVQSFYKKHLGTRGCEYKTLNDPMTQEWVDSLVDDAISRLSPS